MTYKDYYDGNRIAGKREQEAQRAVEYTYRLMEAACNAVGPEPGAKVAMMTGMAMVPLASISLAFASKEYTKKRKENNIFSPEIDEIIFGACYVQCAVEEHPGGTIAAFSLEALDKALRLFKTIYGRDYPHICDNLKTGLAALNDMGKEVPDSVKSFLPE